MRHFLAGLALMLVASLQPAFAQHEDASGYPSKVVRIIVPFAAGGGSDILARVIALQLTERFGKPVIVENRPGAGGSLGANFALKSRPDGYTLLLASSSYATNPTVLKLPFDPINDMTPVIELGVGPMVVTVNPTLPVHCFPDLVAYLKANPDTVPFGSTGIGGLVHLATVSFMLETHTKMIHVPYKGSSEIVPDLVSGRTKIFFADVGTVGKLIGAGQLRGLAVSGTERLAEMPDVPTLAELGYKPYAFGLQVWQGVLAPKGTPAPIVDRLNSEINRIIRIDTVVRLFETQYYAPVGGPPENFGDLIRSDIQRWTTVAKAADVKVE